jgi:hypothetical protein
MMMSCSQNSTLCMAKPYDQIIKENLQSVFVGLVRLTTGIDIVTYTLIYPELPQTIERIADYVFQVVNSKKEKTLIHLEFQSYNDRAMPERMLLYYGLLYKIYKLPIRQIVFYIGEAKLTMASEIKDESLTFTYTLVDLHALSYRQFLESDTPEMVILTVLTDFEENKAQWIVAQIFIKLKQLDENPTDFQRHIRQLDILSVLRKLQQEVINQEKIMALTLNIENDLRYQQGREQGREQAREQAREMLLLQKKQIAINMLNENFDPLVISKITGLTLEQVKGLLEE